MTIDWKLLSHVRERQKKVALEALARERRALEATEAQAQAAHAQWREQVDAQAAHWQGTAGAMQGGSFSAAQLRDAATGSRALDVQIRRAAQAVSAADAVVAQQQQAFDLSRQRARAASGEVVKAEQMQQRERAQHLRALERRQEDAADDSAVQGWLARRIS